MTWTFWPGVLVGIWLCMGIVVLLFIVKELLGPPRISSIDYCDNCAVPLNGARIVHDGEPICFDCHLALQIINRQRP